MSLMDDIDREIRERREKVHLWGTDDGYMCKRCYDEWLPKEARRQHEAEPDGYDDDADIIDDIDTYQVQKLREQDFWEFEHFPIECEVCHRPVVAIHEEYVYPCEEEWRL